VGEEKEGTDPSSGWGDQMVSGSSGEERNGKGLGLLSVRGGKGEMASQFGRGSTNPRKNTYEWGALL